jgi:hypothetical protein
MAQILDARLRGHDGKPRIAEKKQPFDLKLRMESFLIS